MRLAVPRGPRREGTWATIAAEHPPSEAKARTRAARAKRWVLNGQDDMMVL